MHPGGGCGFARHGTYARAAPPGTRIARWYCPRGHRTFSALPDCLCSHLSGDLVTLAGFVQVCEQAVSLEAAARDVRCEIELPGVLRFLRRRVSAVHRALVAIRGLEPLAFFGVVATLAAFAVALDVAPTLVLMRLRARVPTHLSGLPTPLGFDPARPRVKRRRSARQHRRGADPPAIRR